MRWKGRQQSQNVVDLTTDPVAKFLFNEQLFSTPYPQNAGAIPTPWGNQSLQSIEQRVQEYGGYGPLPSGGPVHHSPMATRRRWRIHPETGLTELTRPPHEGGGFYNEPPIYPTSKWRRRQRQHEQ